MPSQATKSPRTCEYCGSTFYRYPSQANRFCSAPCHYAYRLDPATIERRFWRKVDRNGPTVPHVAGITPCWIWTGNLNSSGYGRFGSGLAVQLAHRVSWELTHGPIPDGFSVLHRCDNPPCVRPDHLFLGTYSDNGRDMAAKGRGGGAYFADRTGTKNHSAKLNDEAVREVRRLLATGHSDAAIGRRFQVSPDTIRRIKRGEIWKHVE